VGPDLATNRVAQCGSISMGFHGGLGGFLTCIKFKNGFVG
jgi:hypothetical protein